MSVRTLKLDLVIPPPLYSPPSDAVSRKHYGA
jgi:hypothetical protein